MATIRRLAPLFDRVLVQRIKPVTQVGGIVLPESATRKNNEARVVAVGKGHRNYEGKCTPPSVSVGDKVMLADYRADEILFEGEELLLIREEDILAVIQETPAHKE